MLVCCCFVLIGGSGRARDPTRHTKQKQHTSLTYLVGMCVAVCLCGGSGRLARGLGDTFVAGWFQNKRTTGTGRSASGLLVRGTAQVARATRGTRTSGPRPSKRNTKSNSCSQNNATQFSQTQTSKCNGAVAEQHARFSRYYEERWLRHVCMRPRLQKYKDDAC